MFKLKIRLLISVMGTKNYKNNKFKFSDKYYTSINNSKT